MRKVDLKITCHSYLLLVHLDYRDGGQNSSVGSVLDSLSCVMHCRGFDPPLKPKCCFHGSGSENCPYIDTVNQQ